MAFFFLRLMDGDSLLFYCRCEGVVADERNSRVWDNGAPQIVAAMERRMASERMRCDMMDIYISQISAVAKMLSCA